MDNRLLKGFQYTAKYNLASAMPEKTEEMKKKLFQVWDDIETEGLKEWWLNDRQKRRRGATLN